MLTAFQTATYHTILDTHSHGIVCRYYHATCTSSNIAQRAGGFETVRIKGHLDALTQPKPDYANYANSAVPRLQESNTQPYSVHHILLSYCTAFRRFHPAIQRPSATLPESLLALWVHMP